jgi:protein gp37
MHITLPQRKSKRVINEDWIECITNMSRGIETGDMFRVMGGNCTTPGGDVSAEISGRANLEYPMLHRGLQTS